MNSAVTGNLRTELVVLRIRRPLVLLDLLLTAILIEGTRVLTQQHTHTHNNNTQTKKHHHQN